MRPNHENNALMFPLSIKFSMAIRNSTSSHINEKQTLIGSEKECISGAFATNGEYVYYPHATH